MTGKELLTAIESAIAGSEVLDRAIADSSGIIWSPDENGNWGGYGIFPRRCHFTRDFYAARTLVPAGWWVFHLGEERTRIQDKGGSHQPTGFWVVELWPVVGGRRVIQRATTLELALACAALKARDISQ